MCRCPDAELERSSSSASHIVSFEALTFGIAPHLIWIQNVVLVSFLPGTAVSVFRAYSAS